MRCLSFSMLLAFTVPVYGADKDEDKAKAVVGDFLKAVVAKDIDAVMKTVDAPFTMELDANKPATIEKQAELKEEMSKLLRLAEPDKVKTLKVGKVYDMAGIAKYIKDDPKNVVKNVEAFAEQAEKLVGKTGFLVILTVEDKDVTGFLIRIKDGKAFVAGVPK
jgi:hypothetical protein